VSYTTRLTADERERWGDDEPALGTLDERLDIIIARHTREFDWDAYLAEIEEDSLGESTDLDEAS
jgi:hypothetical protein